jgi:hypothetical protein
MAGKVAGGWPKVDDNGGTILFAELLLACIARPPDGAQRILAPWLQSTRPVSRVVEFTSEVIRQEVFRIFFGVVLAGDFPISIWSNRFTRGGIVLESAARFHCIGQINSLFLGRESG